MYNGYVTQKGDVTAHGKTLKETHNVLYFKVDRNKLLDEYKSLDVNKPLIHNKLREIYRNITGSCNFGIDNFIKNNDISNIKTINNIIFITNKQNEYMSKEFFTNN